MTELNPYANSTYILELVKRAQDGCLDELVIDLKSKEASSINNEGTVAQVNFIIESCGIEALEEELKKQELLGEGL